MSRNPLYPDPAHLIAGFCFESDDPEQAFLKVCRQVIAAGAKLSGAFWTKRAEAFPRFTMDVYVESKEAPQLPKEKAWHWLQNHESDVHVLKAGFTAPVTGVSIVEYLPIPEGSTEDVRHPIGFSISSSSMDGPDFMRTKRDRKVAAAVTHLTMKVFRSTCEAFDPLYAAIACEMSVPPINELISTAPRIGSEVFVSARLMAADPGLEPELLDLYTGGYTERWTTGTFFCGREDFNPKGRSVPDVSRVETLAPRRLRRAVLALFPELRPSGKTLTLMK